MGEPAPRLGHVRVASPEALEGRDRSQRVLDPARGEKPVDRRADVVELELEPVEPRGLSRSGELALRTERELEETFGVTLAQLVERPALVEVAERVLAHRLEHREPHRRRREASLRTRLQPTSASRSGRNVAGEGARARESSSDALSLNTASAPWSRRWLSFRRP